MGRHSSERFKSLFERDQALMRQAFSSRNRKYVGKAPSSYPIGTIGYLAEQMRFRPAVVVEQFSAIGIRGLTPNHLLQESHIDALWAHLQTAHPGSRIAYVDEEITEPKIRVANEINEALLRSLAAKPELMRSLEPRRFEELIARLLEDLGCEVTLTKSTRDGGYDLFGHLKSGIAELLIVAECKRYGEKNKVGVEVVRGLYGVTEMRKANLGLIVTTSSFTKDAQQEKLRIGSRIELKAFDDLCGWLGPYRNPIGVQPSVKRHS
jgi:hypothetical protein